MQKKITFAEKNLWLKKVLAQNRLDPTEHLTLSSDPPAWMAVRIEEYSYSTFNFTNSEVVITQWGKNAETAEKLDEFKIKKTSRNRS